MKHIVPMVFCGVDEFGIWFIGTKDEQYYCLRWNPITWIKNIVYGEAFFGFPPFLNKHINWK